MTLDEYLKSVRERAVEVNKVRRIADQSYVSDLILRDSALPFLLVSQSDVSTLLRMVEAVDRNIDLWLCGDIGGGEALTDIKTAMQSILDEACP